MELDEEAVTVLADSIQKFGLIYKPIRDAKTKEIIVGRHRVAAAKRAGLPLGDDKFNDLDVEAKAKGKGMSPELYRLLLAVNSNVQRRITREETQSLLLGIAQQLEKEGIPKHEIGVRVSQLVPTYSERWVQDLLPPEYKEAEKARAGRLGAETVKVRQDSAEATSAENEPTEPETSKSHIGASETPDRPEGRLLPVPTTPAESAPGPTTSSAEVEGSSGITAVGSPAAGEPGARPLADMVYPARPRKEPISASEHRKPTYTAAHLRLMEALNAAHVAYNSEVAFQRPETAAGGMPKTYQVDIYLEGPKVALEVEGKGSSSRDNEERDTFFASKGIRVAHLSNPHVMKFADEVAALIAAFVGGTS